MTQQPQWEIIANLGDDDPLDFGGYFVMVDKTGVYPAEGEKLDVDDTDNQSTWYVYRFILEQCTYTDGILSDNKYHPEYAAWFASPADRWYPAGKLASIANSSGIEELELIGLLCHDDPIQRAIGYMYIGDYFGYHELCGGDGDAYTSKFELINHYRRVQRKGSE